MLSDRPRGFEESTAFIVPNRRQSIDWHVFAAKIVSMKSEVLNALLTARTLFDVARRRVP
jgi:hypothetical protein